MTLIRVGNDIHVSWSIFSRNGAAYLIDGNLVRISLISGPFKKAITNFSTVGNIISFTIPSEDIYRLGIYKMVLSIIRESTETDEATFDFQELFQIVSATYTSVQSRVLDGNVLVEPSSMIENVVENIVTNAPDGEDLTVVGSVLKFRNRPSGDGLGYFILRTSSSFADQVTLPNTIYEIRYDFDLNDETISIPENCILKFVGGSLSNGKLVGDNTAILGMTMKELIGSVSLEGTFDNPGVLKSGQVVLFSNIESITENKRELFNKIYTASRYYCSLAGYDAIRVINQGYRIKYLFYDKDFNYISTVMFTTAGEISIPQEAANGFCAFVIQTDFREQTKKGAGEVIDSAKIYLNIMEDNVLSERLDTINDRRANLGYTPNYSFGTKTGLFASTTTGKFVKSATRNSYIYELDKFQNYSHIRITANSERTTKVFFVKNEPVAGADVEFSSIGSHVTIGVGDTDVIRIPSDCVYILIDCENGDVDYTPVEATLLDYMSVVGSSLIDKDTMEMRRDSQRPTSLNTLNILAWNVGHFSAGAHSYTTIADEDYSTKRAAVINLLAKYKDHWLLLEEYSEVFAKRSTGNVAATSVFGNNTLGSFSGYSAGFHRNAVFFKAGLVHQEQFYMNSLNGVENSAGICAAFASLNRYCVVINGQKVHIFHVHLPSRLSSSEMDALLVDLKNKAASYSRVVIVGDWNTGRSSLSVLTDAGYTIANQQVEEGGELVDIPTFFAIASESYPEGRKSTLDWWVYKGVVVRDFEVIQTELCVNNEDTPEEKEARLTDHLPIRLTITTNSVSRDYIDSGAGSCFFSPTLHKPLWRDVNNEFVRKQWVDGCGNVVVFSDDFLFHDGIISSSTNLWVVPSDDRQHALVDVSRFAGGKLFVAPSIRDNVRYAFLKSGYDGETTTPDYATGYTDTVQLLAADSITIDIPEDAEYFYFYGIRTGTTYRGVPEYVEMTK